MAKNTKKVKLTLDKDNNLVLEKGSSKIKLNIKDLDNVLDGMLQIRYLMGENSLEQPTLTDRH